MTRHPSRISQRIIVLWLGLLGAAGFLVQNVFSASRIEEETQPKIECLLPDGQFSTIGRAHVTDPVSATSVLDETTLSCRLRAGETTFIVALPKISDHDRLTFVNENVAASGELRIAVSDLHLAADSPKWTEIDGVIPFSHKRLFNLSLVGIETRFVRLTFVVDGAANVAASRSTSSSRYSFLARAINSHFAKLHWDRAINSAVFGSVAIGSKPLSPNE